MPDRDLYLIDEYLSEDWITAWVAGVIGEIETYLGKHAAFDAFLDGDELAA